MIVKKGIETFMNRIKELRQQKQLDQKDLAQIMQIGKGSISNWEVGRTEPSVEYLIKLANYFEVSVDYLLGHSNEVGIIETGAALSNDEQELLNLYKRMSSGNKNKLLGYAQGLVG